MNSLCVVPYWLALCLFAAPAWAEEPLGGDFTLHTTKGEAVSLQSLRGKVVLIHFGFTQCPDMCPAELLQYQQLMSLLPPERKHQVQPLFVSLDPQRDTPEILDAYVGHFGVGAGARLVRGGAVSFIARESSLPLDRLRTAASG